MSTQRDLVNINETVPAPVPAPVSENGAILSMIERAARDPSVDLEKFERLMAMRERVEDRERQARAHEAEVAFAAAVSAAKAEITPIARNAEGNNKAKYADFSAYATVVDPILAKHGLHYRFRAKQDDRITVTCLLSHRDGHTEETTLSGLPDPSGSKNAIQAIGSTLTYLQRYTLVLSLGLASTKDDDGRAACHSTAVIAPAQVETLRGLVMDAEADLPAFLKYFGVERLEDISSSEFPRAVKSLEAKKRKAHGNG